MGLRKVVINGVFSGKNDIWSLTRHVAAIAGATGTVGQIVVVGDSVDPQIYLCIGTTAVTATTTSVSSAGTWVLVSAQ